jgi:inosine/xanthosine triphosphate pyrophosphatase family protein/dephospho-CoA kinase
VSARLHPSELFHTAERIPVVYFYTSSIEKYLQARFLFTKHGLSVSQFRSREKPYAENYDVPTSELLRGGLKEVTNHVGASSLVFIEDTSLRIEGLSKTRDVPGLAVKEWFKETSFAKLEALLKRRKLSRRITIKSDIAIHIPGLARPVFFHGESHGELAKRPWRSKEPVQYPWLSPDNFSAWFAPDGARGVQLSALDVEQSVEFDFRAKALQALLMFLEELTASLNLPSAAYSRRPAPLSDRQVSLFAQTGSMLLVVGRTCAGKTTLGHRLSINHGLRHIEASGLVRMLREKEGSSLAPLEYAQTLMARRGPAVVAEEVLRLHGGALDDGFVITGFRTIEELQMFKERFPRVRVVYVDANERLRYDRHLARGRGDRMSLVQFREHDRAQWGFGLLPVAEEVCDMRIVNEESMESYLTKSDSLMRVGYAGDMPVQTRGVASQRLRCLRLLREKRVALTNAEITSFLRRSGVDIRANNVNKVLRSLPELVRRVESPGAPVRYQIVTGGAAYVSYMEDWILGES